MVGCYYYTYAQSPDEALTDAERFADMLVGKQFEYPVYLDLEDPSLEELGSEILTEICNVFIETMQKKGYFCGLYANENWISNLLDTEWVTTYFDIWYARWTLSGAPEWSDTYGDKTGLWQYSCEGRLGEHECDFDLNVSYKDYPSLIKQYSLNGFGG